MRVRAKEVPNQKYSGYYDHKRRLPGEIFELKTWVRVAGDGRKIVCDPEEQLRRAKWFERVDKVTEVQKPIEQPAPEIVGDDVI